MSEADLNASQAKASSTAAIEMRKGKQLTDFTILCSGNKQFPCHRTTLSAACPYFNSLFVGRRPGTASFNSMTFTMLNPAALEIVLDFFYGASFKTPTDCPFLIAQLVQVADFLQMTELYEFCCAQMVAKWSGVVAATEFLALKDEDLKELLTTATAKNAPADTSIGGVMAWAHQDEANRKDSLAMVLGAIKLKSASPNVIADLLAKDELVKAVPDVVALLKAPPQ